MEIHKFNPFPSGFLNFIDVFSHSLMRPWRISLDQSLSCFSPTTKEWKKPHAFMLSSLLTFPICSFLFIVLAPIGITGLFLWILICKSRSNFRISVSDTTSVSKDFIKENDNYMQGSISEDMNIATFKTTPFTSIQKSFGFASLNVCFLQEIISRYNNLSHTGQRADQIGKLLLENQQKFSNNSVTNGRDTHDTQKKLNGGCSNKENSNGLTSDEVRKTHSGNVNEEDFEMDVTVCSEFPNTDFLVFQETWDNKLAERMMSHLHKVYPYIVYDAGERGLLENGYCNNSALMIASKFPFLEVQFHLYPHRYSQDVLSAKGLLQVKVDLGQEEGKRKVGFIHATHLQVYPGTSQARIHQLDNIVTWTKKFRSEAKNDEIIKFDVVAGDFNFDNTSPVDRRDHCHGLFKEYRDICRIEAGRDQPFVVGTDMRHPPLHDDLISNPKGLKAALDDPILRQYYIMDGNRESDVTAHSYRTMTTMDQDGNVISQPLGGKRRVDYILFRECDNVIPTAYNNVTLLAGLTDHISVSLTLEAN